MSFISNLSHKGSFLLAAEALLAAMVSLQIGAAFAKGLFPQIGAEGATFLRLALAAILLICLTRPWRARFSSSDWPWLIGYGLAMGGMNLLFYMAIARVPLGIAIALMFAGPLTLALVSSRRLVDFLWIGLALVGLLLLLPFSKEHPSSDLTGVMLALAAGACWAAYIFAGKRAGRKGGPQVAAVGIAIAALAVAPLGASKGLTDLNLELLMIALAVAVLSSAVPFTLEMVSLKRLPTGTFSTLTSVEPAVAALVGLLALGEQLSAMQWIAIAAIVVASIGATMTVRPTAVLLPD